jgi:hypothetical protein
MVIGGLGTFIGLVSAVNSPSGSDPSGVEGGLHLAGLIIGAVGVPLFAGGIALRNKRKITLDEKWLWTAKKIKDK